VSFPTPQSLQKINRRLDRQRRQAELALAAMRDCGATLQHFGGNDWRLSNGKHVPLTVARILTFDRHVVPVGDSLFGAELSQTWRWVD
jgi:hypothetical protein